MIRNRRVLFFFRLIVGGIFIWAGLLKIFSPLDFAQNIKNYRLLSSEISFWLALFFPWVEMLCGAFLILGVFRRASSLLLSLFLLSFIILVSVTILRGIDTDCGCFGSLSRKADIKLLLLDSVLFFFCLNIFLASLPPSKKIVRLRLHAS